MSVIERIEGMKNELSRAELNLFQYIKENSEKVPSMTAKQLATATKISAPTVVRFAKKVGYRSFTDLKIQLSAESQQSTTKQGYADVAPNEPLESLKEKLSHNAQVTMQETITLMNDTLLMEAVKVLKKKERLFVAGVGASELIARDIQQKWSRIGKPVHLINDYNLLIPQLVNNKKDAVLWLVSNSGHTPEIVSFAEVAHDLGIPVITLTRFGSNPLAKIADISLQVSRSKEASQRSAATNSILAHFLAVEILFYLYISRTSENAEKIYQSRKVIKDYRERYW